MPAYANHGLVDGAANREWELEETMKRIAVILIGCLAVNLPATDEARADCKLIINVDRTGSMRSPLVAGGPSKCVLSENAVLAIIDAYLYGVDYKMGEPAAGPGRIPGDVVSATYDQFCRCQGSGACLRVTGTMPLLTASHRLVQVREFRDDVAQVVWAGKGLPDFLPVNDAQNWLLMNSGWYNGSGIGQDTCPDASTPLAAAMCTAAAQFPVGGETGGETIDRIKTTTDGGENSSEFANVTPDTLRCKTAGDSDEQWHGTVNGVYDKHGLPLVDATLWSSVSGTLSATSSVREPRDAARARTAGLTVSSDEEFFANLSALTGGTFELVTPSTPIPPEVSMIDSDGDGIPDFRDRCVGACTADLDHDGIPDADDLCPTLAEDGNLPFRFDGCPDTDVDGIQDGTDKCLGVPEDHFEPFPNDGCPAAHWSASSNLKLPFRGAVCSSQLVISPTGAASQAKLSIAGNHSSRAGLRGVLFHNIEPSVAFAVGTFPAGSGPFSFSDRPIEVAPGSATGLWTLCIIDTNGFGFSGVLNSWSIHD